MTLPQLIRVVKENTSNEEEAWKEQMMDAESIVKMKIGFDRFVDSILINMAQRDIDLDKNVVLQIQDDLQNSVESSF